MWNNFKFLDGWIGQDHLLLSTKNQLKQRSQAILFVFNTLNISSSLTIQYLQNQKSVHSSPFNLWSTSSTIHAPDCTYTGWKHPSSTKSFASVSLYNYASETNQSVDVIKLQISGALQFGQTYTIARQKQTTERWSHWGFLSKTGSKLWQTILQNNVTSARSVISHFASHTHCILLNHLASVLYSI